MSEEEHAPGHPSQADAVAESERALSLPLQATLIILSLLLPFIGPLGCILFGAASGSGPRSSFLMKSGIVLLVVQFMLVMAAVLSAPLYVNGAQDNSGNRLLEETLEALVAAENAHYKVHGQYADLDELIDAGLLDAKYADRKWQVEHQTGLSLALDGDRQDYDAVASGVDSSMVATKDGIGGMVWYD
jgi:hypothetical protein